MIARVNKDIRERMPLHASATSRDIVDKWITLPSRKTGTPNRGRVSAAILEASNWSGNVIWLNTIVGMGIASNRTAQGNKTARNRRQPKKRITKQARRSRSEVRARKSSAPIWPNTRTTGPKTSMGRTDHDGLTLICDSRSRSCQTTKHEKRGTKKPWEKFGSFHHWLSRRAKVDQ